MRIWRPVMVLLYVRRAQDRRVVDGRRTPARAASRGRLAGLALEVAVDLDEDGRVRDPELVADGVGVYAGEPLLDVPVLVRAP